MPRNLASLPGFVVPHLCGTQPCTVHTCDALHNHAVRMPRVFIIYALPTTHAIILRPTLWYVQCATQVARVVCGVCDTCMYR